MNLPENQSNTGIICHSCCQQVCNKDEKYQWVYSEHEVDNKSRRAALVPGSGEQWPRSWPSPLAQGQRPHSCCCDTERWVGHPWMPASPVVWGNGTRGGYRNSQTSGFSTIMWARMQPLLGCLPVQGPTRIHELGWEVAPYLPCSQIHGAVSLEPQQWPAETLARDLSLCSLQMHKMQILLQSIMKWRWDEPTGLRGKETDRAFSYGAHFHPKREIELVEDVPTSMGSLSRD